MALQGNLRDFAVAEILGLLGTQKKTGCLSLEQDGRKVVLYVQDGRVIASREPGMDAGDPLLRFLRRIRGLSDEQVRGIQSIHKETQRDLEDLLLNGRYLDADTLTSFLERYILDALLAVSKWESGTYRFDPHVRWNGAILVRLSMEGALIEAARRVDEQKRFQGVFRDSGQLLGVRDLPDPDEPLSEEERELFGIIDGQHTIQEVIAAAPLTEYESYEALHRMLEANWIEVVGRRDAGRPAGAAPMPREEFQVRPRLRVGRELVGAVAALLMFAGLIVGARVLARPAPGAAPSDDVFVAAQVANVRSMLELYRRENGRYPATLAKLVEDDWLGLEQVRFPRRTVTYKVVDGGRDYQLDLSPAR